MKEAIDGSKMLDELLLRGNLRNDAALSRYLEIEPSTISKVRTGHRLGATTIVRISERFDLTATEIYELGRYSAPQQYHDNPAPVSESAAHQ
jgi:plasmid maintenance system antidote protein VapI